MTALARQSTAVASPTETMLALDQRLRSLKPLLERTRKANGVLAPLLSDPERDGPMSLNWLQKIPDHATTFAIVHAIEDALETQAETPELKFIAAWLIDSFPARREEFGPGHHARLVMALEWAEFPVSAAVAMSAAQYLAMTTRFCPMAVELVEAVTLIRKRMIGARYNLIHLAEMRESAIEIAFRAGLITEDMAIGRAPIVPKRSGRDERPERASPPRRFAELGEPNEDCPF